MKFSAFIRRLFSLSLFHFLLISSFYFINSFSTIQKRKKKLYWKHTDVRPPGYYILENINDIYDRNNLMTGW